MEMMYRGVPVPPPRSEYHSQAHYVEERPGRRHRDEGHKSKRHSEGSPRKSKEHHKKEKSSKEEKRKSKSKSKEQQQTPPQEVELRYVITEQEYQQSQRVAREKEKTDSPGKHGNPGGKSRSKERRRDGSSRREEKNTLSPPKRGSRSHHHEDSSPRQRRSHRHGEPQDGREGREGHRQRRERQSIRRQAQVGAEGGGDQEVMIQTVGDVSDAFDDDGLFHFGEHASQE